jgi:predicted phage terminase large subunit-like protein
VATLPVPSALVEQLVAEALALAQLASGQVPEAGAGDLDALDVAEPREPWVPYPHQIPPEDVESWYLWLLLAGRGAGKTDACAAYVNARAMAEPGLRIAIIAPTLGDAVESCVNGVSGLKAHNPAVRMVGGVGGAHVYWPNGSVAKLFGAHSPEDVERLRAGGNRHLAWLEELAAWRQLRPCWNHIRFGLRLGSHPQAVASTTPKPLALLKELINSPRTRISRATTDDNPKLDADVRASLYEDYGETRLGRQELGGEMIEDIEGALWTQQWIDDGRVERAPHLVRVVVAVDPAATHGEDSDETGIAVAGRGSDGEFYVLHGDGYKLSPLGWANRTWDLFDTHLADRVVGEINNGGEMVESTLRQVRPHGPISTIHASRGKTVRAEPVAALYEKGRVHHVGRFGRLEAQMIEFPISNEMDDRVDAIVYALTELLGNGPAAAGGTERQPVGAGRQGHQLFRRR